MDKYLRKRLEEAANIEAIKDTSKGRNRKDYFISAMADHENGFREGFLVGAEYGYKEAIAQAKEWLKKNLTITTVDQQRKLIFNVMTEDNKIKLLADFEADMNKLWEEKK